MNTSNFADQVLAEIFSTPAVTPVKPSIYYRCNVCLTPLVVEYQGNAKDLRTGGQLACDCGNADSMQFEFMGRVQGNVFLKEEQRCKCDARCTVAKGPNCDCVCGGKNHGMGFKGYETVIASSGKVRFNARVDAKALEVARLYRAVMGARKELLDATNAKNNFHQVSFHFQKFSGSDSAPHRRKLATKITELTGIVF